MRGWPFPIWLAHTLACLAAGWLPFHAGAQSLSREQVIAQMHPYTGPHVAGVDTSTLTGKVMCGYQGWFAAPGDGAEEGWVHYGPNTPAFGPGTCYFDLWPDVSELGPDEKFPTPFRHRDGRVAYVFSPCVPRTVRRHFEWMRDYGIDGVFLQRFGADLKWPPGLRHNNLVTANVQAGANACGRTWAVMYDLSGLHAGEVRPWVIDDWKRLIDRMQVTRDPAYLHHHGRPVVAVWGIGFNDGRQYTLAECAELVRFLKSDPHYGGNTVMLGLPAFWRTAERDAVTDPRFMEIVRQADIISPWEVGRYHDDASARQHIVKQTVPDMAWCRTNGKDFLPVIFPGFSWHNLMKARGKAAPTEAMPRHGGQYLWTQAAANCAVGASMIYVAMFDELDEGTAIFKCTDDPPVGASPFVALKGPSDQYLWLTGQIGKMLRREIPATDVMPGR